VDANSKGRQVVSRAGTEASRSPCVWRARKDGFARVRPKNSSKAWLQRGFTLVELLAAMAIVTLLVLLMARIFTESTNMWSFGTRRITGAAEARVIMDYLVREMSMAIADEVITFKLNSDQDALYGVYSYGAGSDEVAFVAMVRAGDTYFRRTANQFVYFIAPMVDENIDPIPNRYRLVRTRRTQSMFNNERNRDRGAYNNPEWWRDMPPDWTENRGPQGFLALETIAENVAAFEVWAWSANGNDYRFSYNSADEGNMLPLWVDIYLELLGEDQAVQAAALWSIDEQRSREFVEANAQRYTARVYFPNRDRALAFRE
jgi:prepilin-type N-terminal cleavage/methylation domain-containing protein